MTSLSWIPSEAIEGAQRLAFDSGITHYDAPPPSEDIDLEELRVADRFRFANELRAWIEVEPPGQRHRLRLRGRRPDGIHDRPGGRAAAQVRGGAAARHPARSRDRGRVGALRADDRWSHGPARAPPGAAPALHPVAGPARVDDAVAHAARRRPHRERALTGASRFPRHWVYDRDGALSHKSGLTDFKDWYRLSFGRHTPWGDQDSEALVTAVETALERSLSARVMGGEQGGDRTSSPPGHPGQAGENRAPRSSSSSTG